MKPFLQRTDAKPLAGLRPPGPTVPATVPRLRLDGCPNASETSPHVDVVKEGDKVVRLVVTCSCGERIEVECLYPPGA